MSLCPRSWFGTASNAQKDAAREFYGRDSEFVGEFRSLALSGDLAGAGQLHASEWTRRPELPRALQVRGKFVLFRSPAPWRALCFCPHAV